MTFRLIKKSSTITSIISGQLDQLHQVNYIWLSIVKNSSFISVCNTKRES